MLTPSGVTRLLDGLERDGWVRKGQCESDARVTYAVLTDEGRERLESAGRTHVDADPRDLRGALLRSDELEAARRPARPPARRNRAGRELLTVLGSR